ncbi:MAG: AbrB/MazE/SpoVT family DNA-binding domain-containing protein [Dehalococcoidia bacterium]|jgi:AbrB family looped-hinge helix DNA binding protein
MKDKRPVTPPGKRFYGSVTVSERGQIVVPTEARKDFDIRTGDKLLVVGDLEGGIGIITQSMMKKMLENVEGLRSLVEHATAADETKPPRKKKKAGE